MNNYIYCYPSFLSNLDTFIMSKRPFKNKFITYYPHESTILVKLVKKNMNKRLLVVVLFKFIRGYQYLQ